MQKLLLSIVIFCAVNILGYSQADCDLTYLTTIEDFNVYTHNPSGAILYRAKMVIDADGSPRAYGPNNSGLDYTANAGYPGNWWGIVTDSNGDPIIQDGNDPYPGMYVSGTSLVQSGYSNYNPLRYVDSENIPYVALPSQLQSLANIAKGDLAYVRNITNGNGTYAYFADTGPGGKLGEGSIKLAEITGINPSPRNGGTHQPIIDYVIFPQSGLGQGNHLTVAEIDSMTQIVMDAAGGLSLVDCLDSVIPPLDCGNTIPLTCGVTYTGSSSNANSRVLTYGCNSWSESGPERVHSVVASANGTLTATISNFTGDLDVYILGSCNPNDCLGTVSGSSATFSNAVAGTTYYIVIDADDGSGSGYDLIVDCPPSSNTDDITITNESISNNTIDAGDTITVNATQNYAGSETNANLPGFNINYYLSTDCNLSPDDTLLAMSESELGSDATASAESEQLIIPSNTQTGSYYILIAADSEYELAETDENNNIACIAISIDALLLDCPNAIPLTCGVSYTASNSTAPSNVTYFGCNSWTETGPERIHTITPQGNGTITATLSNYGGDLDVYILGSCDPNDCLGSVGSETATYTNAVAGQTYYIVVDSDNGSGSGYDIIVDCPTPLDDISITNESLSTNQIEQGETFNISVTQNFAGAEISANLPAFNVGYYLSTDCVLDGADVLLGSDNSNLGSDNMLEVETATLTIPSNTTDGAYNILFVGDYDDQLTEADETNNSQCVAITVTVPTCAPVHGTDIQEACDEYLWINGVIYNSSNNTDIYTLPNQAANGCDSVVHLDLTIHNSQATDTFASACSSFVWYGNTLNSSGDFTHTLNTVNSCDSIITLHLTINQSTSGSESKTECESYTWPTNGTNYTIGGTYTALLTGANLCDSITTLNLTINHPSAGSEDITDCNSYTWSATGATYSTSGTYTALLSNSVMCDSIATLNLTIADSTITDTTASTCGGYNWYGNSYNTSGTYLKYLSSTQGCDSIIRMNLTIGDSSYSDTSAVVCESINWYGSTYSSTGDYQHTLTTNLGCDSTITLHLTVNNTTMSDTDITACESYFWAANGTNYTSSGTYTSVHTSSLGCDSVAFLNLTITNDVTGTDYQSACETYTWIDGNTYAASTNTPTYTFINGSESGCDSIVTLNLTINQPTTGIDTKIACNEYTWIDGNTYASNNNSATYTYLGGAANGCDSLVTLNLTLHSVNAGITSNGESISSMQDSASYQWLSCDSSYIPLVNDTNQTYTPTVTGLFAVEVSQNGCVDTSACESINIVDGISEFETGVITVFPNPTNGVVTVQIPNSIKVNSVEVLNILGQTVVSKSFNGESIFAIELPSKSGNYFLKLNTDVGVKTVRVVRE